MGGAGRLAQGRLGAVACASESLGLGQPPNVHVTAILAKHYFHQSNFYFGSIMFIQTNLLRIFKALFRNVCRPN